MRASPPAAQLAPVQDEKQKLLHLEPRFRSELAHALTHLPLIALLRRVTGMRWAPQ